MNFHPNEIVLIYNPNSEKGKQTFAYANTLSNHVREIDSINTKISPTSWEQILDRLHLEPKQVMDRSSDYYQENIKGHDIDTMGLLEILYHSPDLLAGPIAVHDKKAVLCKSPNDVLKVN